MATHYPGSTFCLTFSIVSDGSTSSVIVFPRTGLYEDLRAAAQVDHEVERVLLQGAECMERGGEGGEGDEGGEGGEGG